MKTFKYNSKLVGVTFEGRQAVISQLKGGEQLRCRREPDNEYDPRAVAVDVLLNEEWLPVGYIAKDKNQEIANSMDGGEEIKITLSNITGGDGKSFGINIELDYKEAVPPATAPAKEAEVIARPTNEQMAGTLKYLLAVVEANGSKKSEPKTVNSVLLGKSIEVQEKNGHVSLEGYLSGSRFPAQFYAEFDEKQNLQRMVDSYFPGVSEKEAEKIKEALLEMWGTNGTASTSFGTAIHAALENYDKNHELGQKVRNYAKKPTKKDPEGVKSPNKAFNRNPILKKIVDDFQKRFGGDYIRFNEEFIWDKGLKLCGSVDRIKVVDLKRRIIRIQDYKTDADIHEKKYQLTDSLFYDLTQGKDATMGKELLDYHWLQLSFYAFILQRAGWTVEGLDIYWLNGEKFAKGENAWEEYSHDVIDISKAIIGE